MIGALFWLALAAIFVILFGRAAKRNVFDIGWFGGACIGIAMTFYHLLRW